jgi:hypothetical protein
MQCTRRCREPKPTYFFTHALVASSHFMSLVFSQSAYVFGASAANAGALNASKRPATTAVLMILADMIMFPLVSRPTVYAHEWCGLPDRPLLPTTRNASLP